MYIYLIKYNNQIIAATKDDEYATAVIYQYMRDNKDMDIKLFEKEPIRFFGDTFKKDCQACIIEKITGFTVEKMEDNNEV